MDTGVLPVDDVDEPQQIKDQLQVPGQRMQGVESYWDPVGGERSGFCSRILGEP